MFGAPGAAWPAVAADEDGGAPSLADIISMAAEANGKLQSFKFNVDMAVVMEASGGTSPASVTMVMNGAGALDMGGKRMQTVMTVVMDAPGQPRFESQAESYVVDGWMYVKMTLPSMGTRWVKMRLDEDQWQLQQSQFSPGGEWLQTAAETRLLGSEDLDGTPTYVVEVVPNMETLMKWLSHQQGGAMKDLREAGLDVARLIKRMSVKEWIARDSYLFMRTDIEVAMEVPGILGRESEKLSVLTSGVVRAYDHNLPVSIVLPDDAASAIEAPAP